MFSLNIFLQVFIPVFIIVVYPGPCCLSYANISINYGYKKGFISAFGCFVVDILYCIIGIFALNSAQSLLPDLVVKSLTIFAGLFLLYIAYGFIKTDTAKLEISTIQNNSFIIFIKFFILTLSNPIAIVGYAGIYTGIKEVQNNILTIFIATTCASLMAHSLVVLSSGTIGKLILRNKKNSKNILRIVNIFSASCISGYSIIKILIPTIISIVK